MNQKKLDKNLNSTSYFYENYFRWIKCLLNEIHFYEIFKNIFKLN